MKHAGVVVPADGKENARLIISQTVLYPLESLKKSYPETSKARRQESQAIRRTLSK
jgi:hypothetical protein